MTHQEFTIVPRPGRERETLEAHKAITGSISFVGVDPNTSDRMMSKPPILFSDECALRENNWDFDKAFSFENYPFYPKPRKKFKTKIFPLKRFTPECSLAQYRTDGNGNFVVRKGASVGPSMWPIENAFLRALDEKREQRRIAARLSCSAQVLARYVQQGEPPSIGPAD